MNGTKLWIVRDWLMDKTTSESHPLTAVIVDILNEDIKENLLTVNGKESEGVFSVETIADYVRDNKKIHTIKTIRQIFGWGLKDSKDFADANWDKWSRSVT